MDVQKPHDKFFRESFGHVETTKDFLTQYLPKPVLQMMNLNTLELQKDSYTNTKLQEYFSDLLFKVNIGNKEGYLYLLFEHKSYLYKDVALQLLTYMVEIWNAKRQKEDVKELPIIIPLVIYHGRLNWSYPSSFGELLHGYTDLPNKIKGLVPNFEYLLYDLSRYTDEEMKGSARTKIMLTLLRDMNTKTGEALMQSILRTVYYLGELEQQQGSVGYLETMLHYIFSSAKDLTENDALRIKQQLEVNHIEGSELAMTLAEIWMEKGIEKGIEKGREEGLAIGEAKAMSNMAILLLTNKFGALPQDIKEAIAKADLPNLQVIVTNIFTLQTMEEVRRYL